jgi:hypothetical protein
LSLILRIVWLIVGHRAKLRLIRDAKRQGIVTYLKVLQGSRRALAGLLIAVFVLQLMILSFVGAVVAGVWLLDVEPAMKLWILFGIFAGGFTLPALVLAIALSERVWYKASGAEKIVEDLRKSA